MRNLRMMGVTLLEILLVLAIAAMIIVMSIHYYQAATNAQQVNMAMEQIQAITAAADNLAIGSGSYSASTTALTTNVPAVMGVGSGTLLSATNGAVTVGGTTTATTYTVSMALTVPVCSSVVAKLAASTKITSPACDSSGTLTYTYNNTK